MKSKRKKTTKRSKISDLKESLDILIPDQIKPVGFVDFVMGDDYLNQKNFYPYWQKQANDLNNPEELILDGSLGGGKCQYGGTLINTNTGIRKLQDLVKTRTEDTSESTDVKVFINGNTESLSHGYYSGKKKTVILKTDDGDYFECSLHHRYKVWNSETFSFEWKQANDINKGDLLQVDLTKNLNTKDNEEAIYKEIPLTYMFGKLIYTLSLTQPFISKQDDLKQYVKEKFNYGDGVSAISIQKLRVHLDENYDIKVTNDTVPDYIYNSNQLTQLGYVRGMAENNCTSNNIGVTIRLKSEEMARFAKSVLNSFGIFSEIRKYTTNYTLVIEDSAIYDDCIEKHNSLQFKKHDPRYYGTRELVKNKTNLKNTPLKYKLLKFNYIKRSDIVKYKNELRSLFNPDVLLNDCNAVKVIHKEYGENELFDLTNPNSETYRANGVISHNTTFGLCYILYRIYQLLLIPDICKHFGVVNSTMFHIIYFNVSLKAANRSGYGVLKNLIDNSKWFNTYYPRDKSIDSEIRFPKNVSIIPASGESHQISLNVIGFILDEANFRQGVGIGTDEQYHEVLQLYSQLIDRQITRFMRPNGSEAFGVLISSASYQSSFVEKRKNEVKRNPRAKVITSVNYQIHPENYSKEKFDMFIGTATVPPQIVNTPDEKANIIKRLGMYGLPDMYEQFFIQVPETLRPNFITNPSLALQNHAGISTQVEGRFITNFELVRSSYVPYEKRWFALDTYELSNMDDFELQDFLDLDQIEYPERPHSFFFDLSYRSDGGGFTCVRNDSKSDDIIKKHTHIFTLKIAPPPPPAETRITKIHTFMQYISEIVNVQAFGTDDFQSKQLRQDILADLGLQDTRLSIDSSDEFHLHWLRALVDNRFVMRYTEDLNREIREAKHDLKKRRVVKVKGSSDDLFQSLVAAFFLSDVYTTNIEISTDLYRNVVNQQQIQRMMKKLGYKGI